MSLEPRTPPPAGLLSLTTLGVALVASLGSIYLSLAMGLQPCPLCYYQRTFAFALFGVLAAGVCTGVGRQAPLSTLVLPLASAGLALAGFHAYLEATGKLECPLGIASLGTAPQQSLIVFALLTLLLLSDSWQDLRPGGGWSATLGSLLLGIVLAAGSILSAPKLPPAPSQPYSEELKGCRPPYVDPA